MKQQVALIGCGRIGQMHLTHLQSMPNVTVKYIVDDKAKAEDYPGIFIYRQACLEEVLRDTSLSAVVIAASSAAHVALIEKAADYGKAIFCEKPVSFKPNELKHIKAIIAKSSVIFQVGLNRRFDPDFRLLKQRVEAGEIGDIHIIKITNHDPRRPALDFVAKSGGLFFDFNIHDFDMVHFLSDQRVVEAYAQGDAMIEPDLRNYNDIDTAIITLKLESGALVVIDASRETNCGYDQRLEVFGSKGMLRVDNLQKTTVSAKSAALKLQYELPLWSFVERYHQSYAHAFDAFFARVESSQIRQADVAGIDAIIKAVDVANMVDVSFKKGCVVHCQRHESESTVA
ncbi:MAG: Gfo/Idh/MocA family protein [Francisellaceae bacterium]